MGATYKLKRKTGANTTEEVLFPIASVDGLQTALNGKLGTSAKAADSAKLNGQAASHYLNYTNLTNKPTIPTATSQLTNDSGFLTTETYKGTVTSVKVGTTSYTPSSGVVSLPAYPTVPSVGNGTITIKQAGTTKGTFTINQSGDTTIELGDAYVIQAHTTRDANYPLLFKLASGITTTGNTTNSTRYANNIYVNPSTGTVYANDFVVGGKSIVGGGGGVRKLTSYTDTLSINSTTLGAYFNVFCNIAGADEVAIGGKTISLDSERTYFVTVDGMLATKLKANSNLWQVMVTVRDDSNSGYADTYKYRVSATSTLYITHSGQYDSTVCSFTGILCE